MGLPQKDAIGKSSWHDAHSFSHALFDFVLSTTPRAKYYYLLFTNRKTKTVPILSLPKDPQAGEDRAGIWTRQIILCKILKDKDNCYSFVHPKWLMPHLAYSGDTGDVNIKKNTVT